MENNNEHLHAMQLFARIVECGSLAAAARDMGVSRAVVSYHLNKLEQAAGLMLLNRTTRSQTLTEAGQRYYQHCVAVREHVQQAQREWEQLRDAPSGTLRLSAPVNLGLQWLIPLLSDFRHRYPGIELDIALSDEVVDIIGTGLDVAIRGAPLPDSGLQARKLASMATCLCAAPAYLRHRGRPMVPADLAEHDWVLYKQHQRLHLTQGRRSFSIDLQGPIRTNNAAARTALVLAGHGLARIPWYDAQPCLQDGRLDQVLADYELQDIELYAVFPPGSGRSQKVRLLLDYLAQRSQAGLLAQTIGQLKVHDAQTPR